MLVRRNIATLSTVEKLISNLISNAGITISRKGDHGLPVEFAWSTVRGSPVRIPAAKLFRSWLGVCCDPATSPTTTPSTTTPASLPTPCAIQTAPTASQAECGGSEVVVLAVLLSASLLALAVVSGILICERAEKKSLLQALGEVRRNATMRLGQPGGLEERRTTNISTAPLPPDASGYAADDEARRVLAASR